MNIKQLLAIFAVAVMAFAPLAVAGSSVAADDSSNEYGTKVELKDVTFTDINTILADIGKATGKELKIPTTPTAFGEDYEYAEYVVMLLFPGFNSDVIGSETTYQFNNIGKTTVNAKIDIYDKAITDKEMTKKVAISASIKDLDITIANLDAEAGDKVFSYGNEVQSTFVDGEYAKYIKGLDVTYKADSKIQIKGSVDVKFYLEAAMTVESKTDGGYFIKEGGFDIKFSKTEGEGKEAVTTTIDLGPITDVRADVKSNLTVALTDKDGATYKSFKFETDTMGVLQVKLGYEYGADHKNVTLSSKGITAKMTESASIDGKANNKIAVDISENLKSLADGRVMPVEKITKGKITLDPCVYTGTVKADEKFNLDKYMVEVMDESGKKVTVSASEVIKVAFADKATINTKAADANGDANSIKDSIYGGSSDNNSVWVWVVIIVIAALIVAGFYYYQKKKA